MNGREGAIRVIILQTTKNTVLIHNDQDCKYK